MKKHLSLLMALILCISLVGSVALAESAAAVPVITVAIPESINVEDFNTNVQTLLIEEALGVDLQMVVYPGVDYNDKINMMIAAGGNDLQDIVIVSASATEVIAWMDSGVIIPLTQYYEDETISPNLHEAIDRLGVNFFPQITQFDGEIYCIPQFNQSAAMEFPYKAIMNEAWLDALEMEAPTTPDELYALLVKVKETDLNGNGKQDEVGMLGNFRAGGWHFPGWFRYIMNAFIYAGDANYYTLTDGKVGVAYNTDEWREGLRFIRKLFAEGLIPTEILTMDNDQFSVMLNGDLPTTMMLFYTGNSQINNAHAWRETYFAQPPLNGPNGNPNSTYRPSVATDGNFFITKNCENPELAFRVGDLLVSEHFSIMTRWGQEGVDWDYAENIEITDAMAASPGFEMLFRAYDDATFWSSGGIQNRSWRQAGPYIRSYATAGGSISDASSRTEFDVKFAKSLDDYQTYHYGPEDDEVIPKLLYSEDEVEAVAEIQATLTSFVYEWTVNFMAGNLDIEKDWDAYINELNAIGVNQVVDMVQVVYDRMYK